MPHGKMGCNWCSSQVLISNNNSSRLLLLSAGWLAGCLALLLHRLCAQQACPTCPPLLA
jgi:hypothetical protein